MFDKVWANVWQNPNDLGDENEDFKQPLIAIEWYNFLTWSFLQIIVMWKLLIDFRKWNTWNSINDGNDTKQPAASP